MERQATEEFGRMVEMDRKVQMTTSQHTLTIGTSEYIALTAALGVMIDHCESQMADGPKCPYWAHRQSCIKMLEKLRNSTPVMGSTSSWCHPKMPQFGGEPDPSLELERIQSLLQEVLDGQREAAGIGGGATRKPQVVLADLYASDDFPADPDLAAEVAVQRLCDAGFKIVADERNDIA